MDELPKPRRRVVSVSNPFLPGEGSHVLTQNGGPNSIFLSIIQNGIMWRGKPMFVELTDKDALHLAETLVRAVEYSRAQQQALAKPRANTE